ncbi:efflux RND transporter permease subunit [Evansella sp. AB-P1]|uniref:efflux RND transporter permease subunit n=1 Tax=Evansella sp. AB-P1 TaxID=3037653 RepID=UPI00241C33AC|nr:efflux RND transporter permease subunit [Evansella sp. AB-P1]MDG5787196.1 efflux RND transporter permease subunit [Evansella sp. AB-P1]
MNVLKFIVQRKILIGLIVVFIIMLGSYSMAKLDKELLPALEFDGGYVSIISGDMSAIEVERNITNVVERQVLAVDGVEDVYSSSAIGRSSLQILFEQGRGDELIKEIQTVVNTATSNMTHIDNVLVGQYGTSQDFEFFMDVSGGSMEEMTDFAKTILKPRLEDLPEVREVALEGVEEKELSISFNRDKLFSKGLNITDVITVIQQSNNEATVGSFQGEVDTPSLRWNTNVSNVDAVKNITIPSNEGYIALSEIADVSISPQANTNFVWKNGSQDFIFLQIGRVSDVTQIDMAKAIRSELQQINDEKLVNGFQVNEIVSQADYVQESIDGVTNNILIGAIIAIGILLLFLRNIRATFIVTLAIPTSILLTFLVMWVLDYSVNILTLIGLGLGIGMMVDSSIVILESIYRKKEQGYKNLEAVLEGTKEVATAVFASMLTTIVVFLPIGLVGGELGQFVIVLSAVVAITLISSVVVSFTLIPSLSEKFLKLKNSKAVQQEGKLLQLYGRIISWVVTKKRHSLAVIFTFFIMLVSSLFLINKIPMTVMPDMFNRYAEIGITVEPGLSIEEKNTIVTRLNDTISTIDDIEDHYVVDNGNLLFAIVNMTKEDEITREQREINEELFRSLRELEDDYPINSVFNALDGGGGYPVQLTITGDSFDTLETIANDLMLELKDIEGIVGVTNSIERFSIEEEVELKRDAMEDAGLHEIQLKQVIEQAFLHFPIGEIRSDGETVPMVVSWDEPIEQKQDLLDLTVTTPSGEEELSQFIELKSIHTPNEINHLNGERYISLSADIEGRDLGSINRDVQTLISDFDAPVDYSVSLAGDLEQQQELMLEMLLVMAIAIFLVYLVMAVQFNNLIHPVVVMSVIPMTIVGVIIGLFLTQRELSALSAMGIVMLIGIVLNNAILLIDRTNKLRLEGYTVQAALVEAGKNRIRPIFMTTLTTAGGMLPLAIATGAAGNYQAPMATVIISGLLFATFITLLLIPSVYRLVTALGGGLKGIGKRKKQNKEEKVIVDKKTEAVS